jgi:hypothetical protein
MAAKPAIPRWLDLAIRVRQWSLDEQAPALRQACAREEQLGLARQQAEQAVSDAAWTRADLLQRDSFDAAALLRQAAFEAEQSRRAVQARQDEAGAQAEVQRIREHMRRLLAERDAIGGSAERLAARMQSDDARAESRVVDELWLLQLAAKENLRDES